jgi:hypothetical protein
MLEYAGSFEDDPEGDVEWRNWILVAVGLIFGFWTRSARPTG